MIKGSFVQLSTKRDLNNLSGIIAADSAMQLDVGGDLNNKSLTYTSDAVDGASNATRTGITQVASIYIGDGLKGKTDVDGNPLTTFVANVGGDTTFSAGRLDNQGGSSFIDTKGDVTLDAVNVGYQSNSILDNNNFYNQGASADIGSQITGSNDLLIKAGNNISGTATSINSTNGGVGIIAQGNVDFKEGRSTNTLSTAVKTVDKGTFSTTKTQDRLNAQSDTAITSNIEGNTVSMQAGKNISLTGTKVASNFGTALTAGGDVSILAAQNTTSKTSSSQVKKSGAFGTDGGMGFTIGKQQTDDSNASTSLTHTSSNIGAIDGNVIITAGGKYQQTGSNLIAGMGADSDKDFKDPNRGNTVVRAKSITIDSVKDVYTNQSETKSKTSGLTVAVSNSLVDSAKSINSLVDAGGSTDSTRMKGMAGVAGALKVKALAKEANSAGYDLLEGNLKGVGNTRIQATIGSQKSQSNSSSYTEVNQASNITTNNLALIATGAGTDSNINVNGSNLNVSNDALFQADNDFNVNGVAQNSNTRSTNSSSSAAIGGYASTGSGQGASAGITASASRGKGYANSDSTTYANSNINVGGTTTFDIGNDVNLKGGVINTNKAQGVIGGNVNIESLQNTATYDSNQKNIGFTADIDLAGGAGSSLSLNGGKTDINADYKAVGQQSGIFTGDGGFDLVVDGKTTLIGGAITTTDAALAAGLNKYVSKGGIETQDIENTTSYKGDAISVGLSVGNTTGKPQATMNGLGYGTDGDSDSSITKAGITGIAGNSGITTDNQAEYAGALGNVFDATRVNEELGSQTIITKEFGKEAPKAVGDFAKTRMNAIRADNTLSAQEKQDAIAKWDEGGVYRVAAHTALGALGTGSVEGALTTGGVAAAAPTLDKVQANLAKALIDSGMSESIAKGTASGVVSLALLGAGTAAGLDTSSTVTATNVDANNRQLHPSETDWIKKNAKAFAKKLGISPQEAEKRLAQQAAKETDLFWLLTLDKGVDPDAQAFLKSSGQSFKNEKGQQQAYFTTQSNDFSTPSRYAIEANLNKDFYQKNLISGNNDNISQGLKGLGSSYSDKAGQYWEGNSAGHIAKDAGSLAYETGKGAVGAVWDCASGIGQCATEAKDAVVNSAQTMGEEAASINENNLKSIYGQDVSNAQKALLGIRSLGAVASATGASRAVTGGTKILYQSVTNKKDNSNSNSNTPNNNTSNNGNNKADGEGSSRNAISQQAGQDFDFNYGVDNDLSLKAKADRAEQNIANITNSKDLDAQQKTWDDEQKARDTERKKNQADFEADMQQISDSSKAKGNELNSQWNDLKAKSEADRRAANERLGIPGYSDQTFSVNNGNNGSTVQRSDGSANNTVEAKIAEADAIMAQFNRSRVNEATNVNDASNYISVGNQITYKGVGDPLYQAPEHPDFPITSYVVPKEGLTVNMAIHKDQINPDTGQVDLNRIGGFTTKNEILNVDQVHSDLAVKSPDWGLEKTHVQQIQIQPGTRVQESVVGPQTGIDGKIYEGGGNQVEPLLDGKIYQGGGNQVEPLHRPKRSDVMVPIGDAIPLPQR